MTNLAVGVTGLGLPVMGFTLAAQFVQLVSRVPHSKCTVVAVSNINTSPTWHISLIVSSKGAIWGDDSVDLRFIVLHGELR